jgi:CheY-like chemotaxis protein
MQVSSGAISLPKPVDVLYVDDDASFRTAACGLLREEGFSVGEAADGEEALHYVGCGNRPSLVILDLHMPVMNGWDFLIRMRKNPATADIPIVVVSGLAQSGVVAGPYGVVPLLSKPISAETLVGCAKRLSKPRVS